MRYDAVIYDLDGTLLNTLDDLAAAVNHALRENGFPEQPSAAVCAMLGDGMEMLIRRAVPADADDEARQRTLAAFKAYYALHAEDLTRPYPGIDGMLEALGQLGVVQAVVSNKGDPFVRRLCSRYFGACIAAAVGEQPGVRRKPAPDSLLKVMADFRLEPSRTLYVGDSDVDLFTARNAGVDCACVCWGFRTEDQLRAAGAQVLIDDPMQIVRIVEN